MFATASLHRTEPCTAKAPPKGSRFGGLLPFCSLMFATLVLTAPPAALAQRHVSLVSTPLPEPAELPDAFTWVGGLALSSDDRRLGGVSGLGAGLVPAATADGIRILAVTDNGDLLRGDLLFETGSGLRVTGFRDDRLTIERLLDAQTGLPARQAESLAVWEERLAFGFEERHRVGVMREGTRISNLPVPTALRGLARNSKGVEALATLPDGRLLAIAEGVEREGGLRAWIYEGEPDDWPILVYEWDQVFAPTGADVTPDGRFLVISERKFVSMREPLSNRLMVVPIEDIAAGNRLQPQAILDLDPLLGPVANVESVAVMATSDPGEFLVFVATDNNFIGLLPTMIAVLLWRP